MGSRSFNPGEQVFLQGQQTPEFFGLIHGRFAKVRMRRSPQEVGLRQALSQAELIEVLERPAMVFGELDVFLQRPHEYSVFAIDPGEVQPLPAHQDALHEVLRVTPEFGVQTCISFARRLWERLGRFSSLTREEEAIDRLIASSFAQFLTVYRDLEAIVSPNAEHPILVAARGEPVYNLARDMVPTPVTGKGASVFSAVIRPPGDASRVQTFPKGSLICKRDTIGDRLYILVEGVVEIPLGNGVVIQIARPSSVIGEIAVFLNMASRTPEVKRTADCICATSVRAIVLDLEQVGPYLAEHPQLLTELLLAMADRTRETHALMGTVQQRLHGRLFDRLRHALTGFNTLAHVLEGYARNAVFAKPFDFCAHQARQLYNRFRDTLELLEQSR